jgi:hypothetical protein
MLTFSTRLAPQDRKHKEVRISMPWSAHLLHVSAGWESWLLMCVAVVIFWTLAVAGMVALFRAPSQNGDFTRASTSTGAAADERPAPPAELYEQAGRRR